MPKFDIYLQGTLHDIDLREEFIVRVQLDLHGQMNEESEDRVFEMLKSINDNFVQDYGTELTLKSWNELDEQE